MRILCLYRKVVALDEKKHITAVVAFNKECVDDPSWLTFASEHPEIPFIVLDSPLLASFPNIHWVGRGYRVFDISGCRIGCISSYTEGFTVPSTGIDLFFSRVDLEELSNQRAVLSDEGNSSFVWIHLSQGKQSITAPLESEAQIESVHDHSFMDHLEAEIASSKCPDLMGAFLDAVHQRCIKSTDVLFIDRVRR